LLDWSLSTCGPCFRFRVEGAAHGASSPAPRSCPRTRQYAFSFYVHARHPPAQHHFPVEAAQSALSSMASVHVSRPQHDFRCALSFPPRTNFHRARASGLWCPLAARINHMGPPPTSDPSVIPLCNVLPLYPLSLIPCRQSPPPPVRSRAPAVRFTLIPLGGIPDLHNLIRPNRAAPVSEASSLSPPGFLIKTTQPRVQPVARRRPIAFPRPSINSLDNLRRCICPPPPAPPRPAPCPLRVARKLNLALDPRMYRPFSPPPALLCPAHPLNSRVQSKASLWPARSCRPGGRGGPAPNSGARASPRCTTTLPSCDPMIHRSMLVSV